MDYVAPPFGQEPGTRASFVQAVQLVRLGFKGDDGAYFLLVTQRCTMPQDLSWTAPPYRCGDTSLGSVPGMPRPRNSMQSPPADAMADLIRHLAKNFRLPSQPQRGGVGAVTLPPLSATDEDMPSQERARRLSFPFPTLEPTSSADRESPSAARCPPQVQAAVPQPPPFSSSPAACSPV